ncbi:MAG: tRNA uridine-5-carboxymethylaminomethyl(34) synthesis GTPase MnmE [Betaproteobacteria bacterium]
MNDSRPIAAIATASGRGAIGVVRVSGPTVSDISRALTGRSLAARVATYTPFLDAQGQPIDHGIAIYFAAPHSYTGEDVLELQGHGGPVVMQLVLRRVLEAGAGLGVRLASPGEFTERAFLNDKLDLAQAEAVADLIDASTERAARSAARSLAGEFSRHIDALSAELTALRMLVEATLDFPEEEIDFLESADAAGRLQRCRATLAEVLASARRGALLRDGLTVVLVGEPNVGKSSLLNALAGAELAIVTPIAGTTRDRIAQSIQIEGIAVRVVDTAGLRDTEDEVERIGIQRTWEAVKDADCVLHLVDARAPLTEPGAVSATHAIARELAARLDERIPRLLVHNKSDLLAGSVPADTEQSIWLSAATGEGIDRLRSRLLELAGGEPGAESTFIARERHLQALMQAGAGLEAAQACLAQGSASLELLAEELRLAQQALGSITGAMSADALLGEIFSRFCIGK